LLYYALSLGLDFVLLDPLLVFLLGKSLFVKFVCSQNSPLLLAAKLSEGVRIIDKVV